MLQRLGAVTLIRLPVKSPSIQPTNRKWSGWRDDGLAAGGRLDCKTVRSICNQKVRLQMKLKKKELLKWRPRVSVGTVHITATMISRGDRGKSEEGEGSTGAQVEGRGDLGRINQMMKEKEKDDDLARMLIAVVKARQARARSWSLEPPSAHGPPSSTYHSGVHSPVCMYVCTEQVPTVHSTYIQYHHSVPQSIKPTQPPQHRYHACPGQAASLVSESEIDCQAAWKMHAAMDFPPASRLLAGLQLATCQLVVYEKDHSCEGTGEGIMDAGG